VLYVKRKYLVKANKKYRLLLNIPLLFTFIFVYKVMIAILYQKVPSDSKFNLLLEQSSVDQHFSNKVLRGVGGLEKNYVN
jgi:hypothetical protein